MSSAAGDAAADLLVLPAGYRLHEYRFERVLGGGGFGLTYLAVDTLLDTEVAIKEYLPPDLATRGADMSVLARNAESPAALQEGLARFLDESRVLASFRHPNIVRVNRYFAANATAYMVMEYARGQSLKQWVNGFGRPDAAQLLAIVRPLLDGLETIHGAGYLHRDVKPPNIFMRPDGSPMLLDFGAARRFDGGRSLTSIVSPGFAPFEQYHSRGNHGPWSDLYSLGAVMYWLVTGEKPVEAAGRVRDDPLQPATRAGNPQVYGKSLLRAIDWAMDPVETRRPQSVADFRRVLPALALAASAASALPREVATSLVVERRPPPQRSSTTSERRTVVAAVLCASIVDYALLPVDGRARVKDWFVRRLARSIAGIDAGLRLLSDSGDGAVVCLLGNPEDALRIAADLCRALAGETPGGLRLRIGLNLGPIRIAPDVNGQSNAIGDGIDMARRVMNFAAPGQILAARAYFDVVASLGEEFASRLRHLGSFRDRDQEERSHELFELGDAGTTLRQPLMPTTTRAPALDAAVLAKVEARLAQALGPLARVLVRRAAPRAADAGELCRRLAADIDDPGEREEFLRDMGQAGHPC